MRTFAETAGGTGSSSQAEELQHLLRAIGATMTTRAGRLIAAHFGSAPDELAACLRGVGLSVRSDLAVLSLVAEARGLDQVVSRVLGDRLATGAAVHKAGVWWCRTHPEKLLIVCRHDRADGLAPRLVDEAGQVFGATLINHSNVQVVLEIVGRNTSQVLAGLGVTSEASPVAETQCVSWLLQAATSALAVVPVDAVAAVWTAINDAGRNYGIGCVGIEALENYFLSERAAGDAILL